MGNQRKYKGHSRTVSKRLKKIGKVMRPKESSCFTTSTQNRTPEACNVAINGNKVMTMEGAENTLLIEANINEKCTEGVNIGRRIVNVDHFFEQLKKVASHGPMQCGLASMVIANEKRNGMNSSLKLVCKMCNLSFFVSTDEGSEMDLNLSAVAGALSIGCGLSQLQELHASFNLPSLSEKIFNDKLKILEDIWGKDLLRTMSEAAEEERCAAVLEGRVNNEGIPIIDVIADGCWAKRSYKNNYSSLSGAATIIGRRSQKILFMSVRNKYCCICAIAERDGKPANTHKCYRNFEGPSSGMESDIILEGFSKSLEMHNLIYGRIISDGDANTYCKLIEKRPYANYTIEKIECRNHLLRNLCNKLQALKTDTKYPIKFRKLITQRRILTMRRVVTKAISEYKSFIGVPDHDAVKNLHDAISIAPSHAFGRHNKCQDFFCTEKNEGDALSMDIFGSSFWQKVVLIFTSLASHSRSLIQDVDSNVVERYHSMVAKFVGGKRINFCQRNQYEVRCRAAAIKFNSSKLLSTLAKSITGKSPSLAIKRFELKRMKKLEKRHSLKKRKLFQTNPDKKSYGDACEKPDLSQKDLEMAKETFLESLKRSKEERFLIWKDTILQSDSSEWLELRRNLLTASNFGRVVKQRSSTSSANIVKEILYRKSIQHVRAVKHGKLNENVALKQLEQQENIIIKPSGLFVDEEIPFLGASPDGIIEAKDMLVEIKCPYSAYKLGFDQAMALKKLPFFKKDSAGNIDMNTNHDWYFQVQGQLHIARKSQCLLAVWFGEVEKLTTLVINKDDSFWKTVMEEKLKHFYINCLLPEIIDPRQSRNMPIRSSTATQIAVKRKAVTSDETLEKINNNSKVPREILYASASTEPSSSTSKIQ